METVVNGLSAIHQLDALKAAGIDEQQARAMLEVFQQQMSIADLATRHDIEVTRADIEATRAELKRDIKELDVKIESVRAELKADIETIKAELKGDIETTKAELKRDIAELNSTLTFRIVCVVGIGVGFLGTMMAIFRFLV